MRSQTPGGGGGGALTLVLVSTAKRTHRAVAVDLKKRGLSQTQDLSEGGAVKGSFPIGAVVVRLASPGKASWISCN